jgi:hypothetical protein
LEADLTDEERWKRRESTAALLGARELGEEVVEGVLTAKRASSCA